MPAPTSKAKSSKPAVAPKAIKRPVVKRAVPVHKPAVARAAAHKPADATEAKPAVVKSYNFIATVGRRKSAIARVRLYTKGTGKIMVNEREMTKYFPTLDQQLTVLQPLKVTSTETSLDVGAKVLGGGTHGQAEAVRHGIAKALLKMNEEYRRALRAAGCLTRDSRVKERKKYGLKKARRAPQFSKR